MVQALKIFLALMLLVVLVVVWRLFGGLRIARVPRAAGQVPRSLRRGAFSQETRQVTDKVYVRAQLAASGVAPTDDDVEAGLAGLASIRETPRAEFHLRHLVPDSLIRHLTAMFIRSPTEHGYRTLRQFFQALDGRQLLALWDETYARLSAANGSWYAVLGWERVAELRKFLTNLQDNLFLSEAQGNLHAGTHLDLTEEGIVLLGDLRVARIVDATVAALETFGLMPRIRLVGSEFMLGYEDAVGELGQFGYNPARTHDPHVDPLQHMSFSSAETVLRNTAPGTLVSYFRANLSKRRLLYSCILVLVSYYLSDAAVDPLLGLE